MTTIKLNNYYPHLTESVTLEVSEEIAVTLSIGGRMCDSYKRRNPVLHRRADYGTSEDQLPQGSENGLFPGPDDYR